MSYTITPGLFRLAYSLQPFLIRPTSQTPLTLLFLSQSLHLHCPPRLQQVIMRLSIFLLQHLVFLFHFLQLPFKRSDPSEIATSSSHELVQVDPPVEFGWDFGFCFASRVLVSRSFGGQIFEAVLYSLIVFALFWVV